MTIKKNSRNSRKLHLKRASNLLLALLLILSFLLIPAAAYQATQSGSVRGSITLKSNSDYNTYTASVSDSYTTSGGMYYPKNAQYVTIANYNTICRNPQYNGFGSSGSFNFDTGYNGMYIWNRTDGQDTLCQIRGQAYVSYYYVEGVNSFANITIPVTETYTAYSAIYSATGQTPPGTSNSFTDNNHKAGSTVSVKTSPSAAGYTFSGWSTSSVSVSNGSFTMPTNDVFFNGTWTARTDTPYTVELYKQNIADDGYTLQTADTINSKGTTDTQICAALDMDALNSKYPHCHLTEASKNNKMIIGGNGTSVFKLYYDYDTANVSYTFDGTIPKKNPSLPATKAQHYGAAVTVEQSPTLPGYDFSGWTTGDADISSGSFTMEDKDVSITGRWIPHTDTPYTVEYYNQNLDDDYVLIDTEQCTGTTDTMAVAPEKKYTGFSMTPASVTASTSTNIDGEGTTLLKLYFDRNTYDVSYSYDGDTDVTPPTVPQQKTYRYGQTVTLDTCNPTLQGYEFGGWETSDAEVIEGRFTMPDGPVAITGKWIPRTDTPFIVEYYQQSLSDNQYTLAYTFNGKGTTGGNVPHKEFTGFTEVPDSVATEGSTKIKSDGTTLLKLYYDRNVNTVTYAYAGETDVTPPTLPAEATYRYGQTVTLDTSNPSLQGYDFSGWKTSDVEVSKGQFSMPDGPVVITGTWIPCTDTPFAVKYYQQNIKDDDYMLVSTLNGTGTTGANVPHKEFEGFVQTPDSVTAEGNEKICSDGSTVLKLYYDRSNYPVTFSYSGTVPEDAPPLPAKKSYRYGAEVTVPEIPGALSGMSFSGWFTRDKRLSEKAFTVPAQDTQIIGGWSEIHYSDNDKPESPITQPVQTLEDNGSAYIIGYDDGTFRPDDYLTAKQEALMLSRLGLSVTPLSVMPENLEDARYITRKEFLSALLDASGASVPDVSSPMAQAAAQGWITGYTNGELYPEAYITRAQAVTIINRAFGRTATQDVAYKISYADLPKNHWAYNAVIAASTTM